MIANSLGPALATAAGIKGLMQDLLLSHSLCLSNKQANEYIKLKKNNGRLNKNKNKMV